MSLTSSRAQRGDAIVSSVTANDLAPNLAVPGTRNTATVDGESSSLTGGLFWSVFCIAHKFGAKITAHQSTINPNVRLRIVTPRNSS
jgi:hypothetical protein